MQRILDLFKLHGKTALVFGGNRGLGLAMAHEQCIELRTRNIEYRIMIGCYFQGDLSYKIFNWLICFAERVQALRLTLHHSWFGVRYSVFKLVTANAILPGPLRNRIKPAHYERS